MPNGHAHDTAFKKIEIEWWVGIEWVSCPWASLSKSGELRVSN
jgi:hypothetical protein